MNRRTYKQIFQDVSVKAMLMPRNTGWQARHFVAWNKHPVAGMIAAFGKYADQHNKRFESTLSEDYVLGAAWLDGMKAIRTLLNGDLGQMDGGTCDTMICAMLFNEGFSDKDL